MLKNINKFILKNFFRNMEYYEVNMEELKQKQANGAEIIDVRSSQEYNEGHLENAINIPYYEIYKNAYKIMPDKEKEIVLYCEMGSRSKRAYKILKKLGYNKVYNLYGGIENWL